MAQSGDCQQEALGTGGDTATDCGLCITQRTEDPAWPGRQKKKKYISCLIYMTVIFCSVCICMHCKTYGGACFVVVVVCLFSPHCELCALYALQCTLSFWKASCK